MWKVAHKLKQCVSFVCSIKGHMYHHPTLDTKRTDEAQGAIYEIAGQQPDNRWFPGMSMDSDGEVVGVPGLRGGAGGESRWSMGVAGTDLGDALTANIQAMGLGTPVVVKVMSCTRCAPPCPRCALPLCLSVRSGPQSSIRFRHLPPLPHSWIDKITIWNLHSVPA